MRKNISEFDMYIFLVSFRGQKKLGPRPNRSPLGVSFKISDKHPHPFHMGESPPTGRAIFMHSCHCVFTGLFPRTIFFKLLFYFLIFSSFFFTF